MLEEFCAVNSTNVDYAWPNEKSMTRPTFEVLRPANAAVMLANRLAELDAKERAFVILDWP